MAYGPAGPRPSRADAVDGASAHVALGALINLAGRQRMLSHRTVMFLSLVRADKAGDRRALFVASARTALADFTRGRGIIVEGDRSMGLPPLFSARAKALLGSAIDPREPGLTGSVLLSRFISMGQACLSRIDSKDSAVEADLFVLSALTAGDLLAFLNRLVSAFEADLADAHEADAARNHEVRKIILSTIANIEALGERINLIAFSAIVEAARAAEEGETFAIIAKEIKALSSQTQTEAAKMGQAVNRLFEPRG